VQQGGSAGVLPDIRLVMNYELPILKGRLARQLRAWWQKD